MLGRIPKPVVLLILDGWGIAPVGRGNAITQARTPNISSYQAAYPHTQLVASGEAVGLPRGEPGNTETGHLNIGAGQIVYQDLLRINKAIAEGSFFQNQVLANCIEHARTTNGNLHLMGLIGAGGVHSNIEHLFALLKLCKNLNFDRVFLHLFTDGRDSPPTGALSYIAQIRSVIETEGRGKIASIMGRYYAMDRDLRWERTESAYLTLTKGEGRKYSDPEKAIQASYDRNLTDEFIEPSIFPDTFTPVKAGDSTIFFNFRIDRPRQLTKAFCLENFQRDANLKQAFDPYAIKYYKKHEQQLIESRPVFERGEKIKDLFFVTLTEYQKDLPVNVAFPPQTIELPLGRIISDKGMRQLRVSESEKERFVTYFFNGQRETIFPGEERLIIPSPQIATYDLKPEMNAFTMTNHLIEKIREQNYDFILVNFANVDMIGHTGNLDAAIKAVETVDSCVGQVVKNTLSLGGCVVITADHGNAEEMINPKTNQVDTEHSTFPVPLIIIREGITNKILPVGVLSDIAPTILHLLQIPKPPSMFGRNLLI